MENGRWKMVNGKGKIERILKPMLSALCDEGITTE